MNIVSQTDLCILDPRATIATVDELCIAAKENNLRAVCMLPLFVKRSKELLKGSSVKTIAVTGFPFGHAVIESKLAETVLAIVDGADEIEIVINITALKNGDWQYLAKEINTIMPVIRNKNIPVSVIIETNLLTEAEITTCCDIYGAAGVDAVKTSAGYSPGKNIEADTIRLLRKHLADAVKINACGNINDIESAKQLIEAGAAMISSANALELVKAAVH